MPVAAATAGAGKVGVGWVVSESAQELRKAALSCLVVA